MKKVAILLYAMLFFLSGCAVTAREEDKLERTSFMLDTVVQITLYNWQDEETLDRAMVEIDRLEKLLSVSQEGSDLDRLATAAGDHWVEIAPETQAVLEAAKEYWTLSEGYFDVTAGPLIALWNIGSDGGYYPDSAELSQVLSLISAEQLQLEEGRAYLEQAGMVVHLGGIAKGYIADQVKVLLLEEGVTHALINLGGNVLAIGGKTEEMPFRIAVRTPMDESGVLDGVVLAWDESVVTAGTYERNFVHEGKTYHHILDPFTGFPANTGLVSVTVLARESMEADALATSCLLLGEDRGLALIERLPEAEALFLREDGTMLFSSGFGAYYDQ